MRDSRGLEGEGLKREEGGGGKRRMYIGPVVWIGTISGKSDEMELTRNLETVTDARKEILPDLEAYIFEIEGKPTHE